MRAMTAAEMRLRALGAAMLGICAGQALAVDYCVDTADELQNALTAAAASTANDSIRIVVGTYARPGGFITTLNEPGDLIISGGWFTGCLFPQPGQRSTIDGELTRPGMQLLGSFDSDGLLQVSRLNFVRGVSAEFNRAGGLTANPFIATALDVRVERCRFADNNSTSPGDGAGGGLIAVGGTGLNVRNNLFLLNHAARFGGAASLRCSAGVGGLISNTVIDNTVGIGAATDTGGVRLNGSDCVWEAANNIFWGNEGEDLTLLNGGAALRYNDIDDLGGVAPGSSVGNLSVNPLFVSATNPRLRRTSPLVDTGFNEPFSGITAIDLDGGPRLVGERVDIGAYEQDRLFAHDFDPLVIGSQ